MRDASIPKIIPQTKEEEEKRKAFIKKIRQNVPPPIPASRKLADVIKEIGPIYKDDKSADEAQRILSDLRALDLRNTYDTLRY